MDISLLSSNGIDYNRLQNLLINRKWGEADKETYNLMRQASRCKDYYLHNQDVEVFPCEDLLILNNLWLENSDSHFGFSVQSKIWHTLLLSEAVRDKSVADEFEEEEEYEKYDKLREKFALRVGWKMGPGVSRPKIKPDAQDTTSIPRGYYPFTMLINRTWHCQFVNWNIFFERLEYCLKASQS